MIPVNQTKLHNPKKGINGNCLAASLASILELPLSKVPEFEDVMEGESDWFSPVQKWLESLNFIILEWKEETWISGYYLAIGKSERGVYHTVVYKGGKLVHDPHPSGKGIIEIDNIWALLPIDPSQHYKIK